MPTATDSGPAVDGAVDLAPLRRRQAIRETWVDHPRVAATLSPALVQATADCALLLQLLAPSTPEDVGG